MAEVDDQLIELIPEEVRKAYAEELEYIDSRVKTIQEYGEKGWIGILRKATEFLPWVGDAMTESEIGRANATSDVNRAARAALLIKKIEDRMSVQLDDETKQNIRRDVEEMYNGNWDLPSNQ
jgi:hypothetical protein